MKLKTALKEWSVAVEALAQGEMMVLLRKGGIRETQGKFVAQCERALLFPTFEHQTSALLKPVYQQKVKPVSPGWHPETITLQAWADITDIFLTYEAEKVEALSDFHIWLPQLAQTRLKWKPKQPLYVMALRVYCLRSPVSLPWQSAYGGCRSWLDLNTAFEVTPDSPAISTTDYADRLQAIRTTLLG